MNDPSTSINLRPTTKIELFPKTNPSLNKSTIDPHSSLIMNSRASKATLRFAQPQP